MSSSTRWAGSTTGLPLVGKVPPWRQPPKPEDPDAPRPFAWLRDEEHGSRDLRAAVPRGPAGAGHRAIRRGGPSDDEGGPGDTPASVAWLRAGAGRAIRDRGPRDAGTVVEVDRPRAACRCRHRARPTVSVGRTMWDPPPTAGEQPSSVGTGDRAGAAAAGPRRFDGRPLATGSAGSSSAPASMASRATSRSTPAACS